jgi:hypothetical protein
MKENQNVVPLIGLESLREYVLLERRVKDIALRLLSNERNVDLEALSEVDNCLKLLVKNIYHPGEDEVPEEPVSTINADSSQQAVDERRLKTITSIRETISFLKHAQELRETPRSSSHRNIRWVPRFV